jgi:dihydrofolate synthase/folylpolyglutamate synthase
MVALINPEDSMPITSREYAEVLASLYALEAAKGMDFKLERVSLALRNLGNPHHRFASVHIGGTNGKGSVAAMLHAMFSAAGYRVGLYTSPHLVSFTERIRVGSACISQQQVVDLAREVRAAGPVCGIDLTFFELITVMAFLHFARQQVDLAVVEVGLGGRLDATNVLDPEVAVITSIGLDHEEFLGSTIESVAREKAGIVKPARPVVVGYVSEDVEALFAAIAAERAAPLCQAGRHFSIAHSPSFRFTGMGVELEDLSIGLRGSYQKRNAGTAIATALHLRTKFPISEDALRRGLAEVCWPGRLEIAGAQPTVILDGAHNADGIRTLRREISDIVGGRDLHLLFGVMRDKHWHPMVETLGPIIASATLTSVLPPRGESPAVLASAFAPYCPVRVVPKSFDALETVLRELPDAAVLLVTGSLFLIGAVYPWFLQRRGQYSLFSPQPASLPA